MVFDLLRLAVSLRSAWLIRRAWRPTWVSPISPSISARGVRAATESMTTTSSAPERTSMSVISSACSPVSGWRDQQLVDVDADGLGVHRIHGVLGVDVGADAAVALRFGDDVHGQRRLARRLRARRSRRRGLGADRRRRGRGRAPMRRWGSASMPIEPFSPIRMIEPLPNCLSI